MLTEKGTLYIDDRGDLVEVDHSVPITRAHVKRKDVYPDVILHEVMGVWGAATIDPDDMVVESMVTVRDVLTNKRRRIYACYLNEFSELDQPPRTSGTLKIDWIKSNSGSSNGKDESDETNENQTD